MGVEKSKLNGYYFVTCTFLKNWESSRTQVSEFACTVEKFDDETTSIQFPLKSGFFTGKNRFNKKVITGTLTAISKTWSLMQVS